MVHRHQRISDSILDEVRLTAGLFYAYSLQAKENDLYLTSQQLTSQ